jgi:hypothetical protein
VEVSRCAHSGCSLGVFSFSLVGFNCPMLHQRCLVQGWPELPYEYFGSRVLVWFHSCACVHPWRRVVWFIVDLQHLPLSRVGEARLLLTLLFLVLFDV